MPWWVRVISAQAQRWYRTAVSAGDTTVPLLRRLWPRR